MGDELVTSRRRIPGIGSHHGARPVTDEWLTPSSILDRLGQFDLDPCAPVDRPWDTAARHYTIDDDGLHQPWTGRVWLNPPYSEIELWMRRMGRVTSMWNGWPDQDHPLAPATGVALVFARCETRWWFESVWPKATAYLFVKGRVTFLQPDGNPSKSGHNSGGPSVLIAYSHADAEVLRTCGIAGAFVRDAQITGGT